MQVEKSTLKEVIKELIYEIIEEEGIYNGLRDAIHEELESKISDRISLLNQKIEITNEVLSRNIKKEVMNEKPVITQNKKVISTQKSNKQPKLDEYSEYGGITTSDIELSGKYTDRKEKHAKGLASLFELDDDGNEDEGQHSADQDDIIKEDSELDNPFANELRQIKASMSSNLSGPIRKQDMEKISEQRTMNKMPISSSRLASSTSSLSRNNNIPLKESVTKKLVNSNNKLNVNDILSSMRQDFNNGHSIEPAEQNMSGGDPAKALSILGVDPERMKSVMMRTSVK